MFDLDTEGDTDLEGWFALQTSATLSATSALVARLSVGPHQRALLLAALRSLEEKLARIPGAERTFLPFVHLPLLVALAVAGPETDATPVSVVTTLIFAGFDIIDDEADGDLLPGALPPVWSGFRFSEIDLAALLLTSSLPQLALAGLPRSPEVILALQSALAGGILRAAAGQQLDLAAAGAAAVSVEQVEAALVGKSGEEWALFATLGALYALAPPALVDCYAGFARAVGVAMQIADDCHELFARVPSRDLAAGTRTLPLALYLEDLQGSARDDFLCLLDRARTDLDAQRMVADRLRAAGILRECAFIAESYVFSALDWLTRARPEPPAGRILHDLIERASLFPPK